MAFSGALHLSQQCSLYLSRQSNLLQHLLSTPKLNQQTDIPKLVNCLSQVFEQNKKVEESIGVYQNVMKYTSAIQRLKVIIPNHLAILSKTTQANGKREMSEVMQ